MRRAASRRFDLRTPGGTRIVSLSFAVPVRNGSEHACSVRIDGLDADPWEQAILGVDAVQALALAMMVAGAVLSSSEAWREGRLTWNSDRDLGLPRPG